jgi:hypothetical protein
MRERDLTSAVLRLCVIAGSEPDGLPLAAAELMEALSLDEAETDLLNDALLELGKRNLIELSADGGGPGGLRFTITKVTQPGLRAIEPD